MSQRTITAIYRADVSQFISDTLRAKAAVTGFANEVSGSSAKSRQAANEVAGTSAKVGLALTAALGLAGKAAIDWESAWAGVTKTVDGSASQMAELEGGLRNLATTLPATHEEIAAVAEAAGQLGVKREDILGFTETMIAMGESTNLSADEAATSMAQISNVMGTMSREGAVGVERLGSTIVALGNAGASTEKDIVSMATRLSGAGKLIGATESDVLALANAMSSVGIEAQLGGGVMSRVMQQINSAVIAGGEQMEGFAKIAGVSAADFSTAWNSDPVAAIDMFVRGLGGITAQGGDAVQALSDVGIKGTENTSVLLRLSGASDILTESLELGKTAWAENSALQDEAQKRYATTASQLKIARNNAKDAAIDFGSVLAPAIAKASGFVSSLAKTLADLPPSVQGTITIIGGIGAASTLAVGGAIKLTTSMLDLKDQLAQIGVQSPKTSKALGALGKAGAVVAIAAISAELQDLIATSKIADVTAKELTNSLEGITRQGPLTGGLADLFRDQGGWLQAREQIVTTTDALHRFSVVANDATADGFINSLERATNSSGAQFDKYVQSIDSALVEMVRGGSAQQAAEVLDQFVNSVDPKNRDRVRAAFTGYAEAIDQIGASAAAAQGKSAEFAAATGESKNQMAQASIDAEAYSKALNELSDTLVKLGGGLRAEQQAIADSQEAYKAAQEAVKGTAAEQDAALRNLSATYLEVAARQVDMGRGAAEVGSTMAQNRQHFIDAAVAMGLDATYAAELADAYGLIPDQVSTMVTAVGATTAAEQVTDLDMVIRGLNGKTVTVQEAGKAKPSKQNVLELDGAIFGLKDKTVKVQELGATASGDRVVKLKDKIYVLTGKTVNVQEQGATPSAGRVVNLKSKVDHLRDKQIRISEAGASAATSRVSSLANAVAALRSKSITVTVGTIRTGNGSFNAGQFAGGGAVWGPGTATSDSIDARLSNGEFVQRTVAARHWGYDVMAELNDMSLSAASLRKIAQTAGHLRALGLAGGGAVGTAAPRSHSAQPATYATSSAPAVVSPVVRVNAPSLDGLPIRGELVYLGPDLVGIRGIVQDELVTTARNANRQGVSA